MNKKRKPPPKSHQYLLENFPYLENTNVTRWGNDELIRLWDGGGRGGWMKKYNNDFSYWCATLLILRTDSERVRLLWKNSWLKFQKPRFFLSFAIHQQGMILMARFEHSESVCEYIFMKNSTGLFFFFEEFSVYLFSLFSILGKLKLHLINPSASFL